MGRKPCSRSRMRWARTFSRDGLGLEEAGTIAYPLLVTCNLVWAARARHRNIGGIAASRRGDRAPEIRLLRLRDDRPGGGARTANRCRPGDAGVVGASADLQILRSHAALSPTANLRAGAWRAKLQRRSTPVEPSLCVGRRADPTRSRVLRSFKSISSRFWR